MAFPPHTWTYELLTSALLGLLEWRGKPKAYITYTTTQSLTDGAVTALNTAPTTVYDTDSMVDATNKRIKITSPGWYVAVGQVVFAANSTGPRKVQIRHNGTLVGHSYVEPDTSTPCPGQAATPPLLCTAGDYFDVTGQQSSGGALNTYNSTEGVSFLSVHMVDSATS